MAPLSRRTARLSLLSGAAWGLVAWLLWPESSAPPVWGALLASPIIGFGVGAGFRWIHGLPRVGRVFVSLFSLYAAAAVFGLAVGFTDLARLRARGVNVMASEVVLQSVAGVLWGVTFSGYVLVLWPLAYWNHRLLGKPAASARGE